MRTLITYYSFSGNTDRVAKAFAGVLKERGEVDVQRLKPKGEIANFGSQCMAAFTRKRTVLEENTKFDIAPYDLAVIGSPVWAFAPTPAVNTFLDKLSGVSGKRIVIVLTSGSGVGVKRCFGNIRKILESKGAGRVDEINIPDSKQGDSNFITDSLRKIL